MLVCLVQGQSGQMHGLGEPQRALLGTIEVAIQTADRTQKELEQKADLPDVGSDPVRQCFTPTLVQDCENDFIDL